MRKTNVQRNREKVIRGRNCELHDVSRMEMSDVLRRLMAERAQLRKIVDEWLDEIRVPAESGEIIYPPRAKQETQQFPAASDALQWTEQAIADFFRHIRDPE